MLTCNQIPGGAPSGSAAPANRTRPSAGATTTPGDRGGSRDGSRKNRLTRIPRLLRSAAANGSPATRQITDGTNAKPMNGNPARSMNMSKTPPVAERHTVWGSAWRRRMSCILSFN